VERSDLGLELHDRIRRLRGYRSLANALLPLVVIAVAVLVFRWMFPGFFSVLVWVWTADVLLLAIVAVPWLLIAWSFASGRIKCPVCAASFASRAHLWVPKACQACGYDVTLPVAMALAKQRGSGRQT
jgi:hypothetical protein